MGGLGVGAEVEDAAVGVSASIPAKVGARGILEGTAPGDVILVVPVVMLLSIVIAKEGALAANTVVCTVRKMTHVGRWGLIGRYQAL